MKEIHKILVMGAGVMGHGIAIVCARSGFSTYLMDVKSEVLDGAMSRIKKFFQGSVQRKKMSPREAQEAINRITTAIDFRSVAPDVDLVIEAVVEVKEVKAELFSNLHKICGPNVIFCTNTSQISVTELGRASGRDDRFIGMHWFNPPPLMKLIELPVGMKTSEKTIEIVSNLCRKLGKEPVVCKDTPGFVVNRILNVWYNEGLRLLDEGASTIDEIDKAVRDGGGFRMGPFELRDLVGLDVALHVTESLYKRLGHEKFRPPDCLKERVAAGNLGRKSGQGFYTYR